MFEGFEQFRKLREAWSKVRIEREVRTGLFTFGDSDLPYFLVTSSDSEQLVRIRRGSITISRARIITPENMHPELRNFFEEQEDSGFLEFLMSRTAAFSNLRLTNQAGADSIVTDTVEEAVARLKDEEQTAILSAPATMAGFAVFRYASERIISSAPDNIQELRERGFLPGM
jgi:hypothetical protein